LIAFISPRGHFAQLLPIEEGASALATFSIAQDLEKRIPMIKKAATMIDDDLVLSASSWSPEHIQKKPFYPPFPQAGMFHLTPLSAQTRLICSAMNPCNLIGYSLDLYMPQRFDVAKRMLFCANQTTVFPIIKPTKQIDYEPDVSLSRSYCNRSLFM